ncbi:MAG TPA: hypothetical protein VGQ05_19580 [Streptosporangiaceae bacterium]|jgi:hypothetical protein|nr:hypothetical protein [Streptosporangiaceae bacterium]
MRPRLPGRSRRSLAVLVVALLAVGAFFARGPIGLGNGPLTFASDSGATLGLARPANVALVVPVRNPGRKPAVINGFTLVGGGNGYAAPKLVHSFAAHNDGCQSLMLASDVTANGCATGQMKLAGVTVPPSQRKAGPGVPSPVPVPSLALVAVLAPPAAGTCWTLRRMAVHYRVGIRHFTATTPEQTAVCAPGLGARARQAALASVGG